MSGYVHLLAVWVACVAVTSALRLPPPRGDQPTCTVGGKTYQQYDEIEGYSGNPCHWCRCERGAVFCHEIMCDWPTCFNGETPIMEQGVCCAFCPSDRAGFEQSPLDIVDPAFLEQ